MKKLCVLIAVCAMSLMAMAQKSELVGTWQQLDANGNPTTQVKVFMPDGKLKTAWAYEYQLDVRLRGATAEMPEFWIDYIYEE